MKNDDDEIITTEDVQFEPIKKENKKSSKAPIKKQLKGFFAIVVLIAFLMIVSLLLYILDIVKNNPKINIPEVELVPSMEIHDQGLWETHVFYDAFSIKVPVTVEKRTECSAHVSFLDSIGMPLRNDAIVFAQKGLDDRDSMAFGTYCRIMIKYSEGDHGDFLSKDEAVELDMEFNQVLDEMVKNELCGAHLIGAVDRKWVRINNANSIIVSYRRTGNPNPDLPVNCRILLFQNDNRFVKMILAYREEHADLWANDFEQIIRSFKWIN